MTVFDRLKDISSNIRRYQFAAQYLYIWEEAVAKLKQIASQSDKPISIIPSRPFLPKFDDYLSHQYFLVFKDEQIAHDLYQHVPRYCAYVTNFLRDCYTQLLQDAYQSSDLSQLIPHINLTEWASSLPPQYRFLWDAMVMVSYLAHTAYLLSPMLVTPVPFSFIFVLGEQHITPNARLHDISICPDCKRFKTVLEYCYHPLSFISSDEFRKLTEHVPIPDKSFDYLVFRTTLCACPRGQERPPVHPSPCACPDCVYAFFYPTVNNTIPFDTFAELLYIELMRGRGDW